MQPFRKYVLLQIPGWGLAAVVLLWLWSREIVSAEVGALLGALWVAKDFAFYPIVRIAYEPSQPAGSEALVGETGVVRRRLDPKGMVRIRGEIWGAESLDPVPVEVGAEVRVERAEGLRLFVRPAARPLGESRASRS